MYDTKLFYALFAMIAVVAFLSCVGNKAKQNELKSTEGEWVSLFNGEDLTGWIPKIRGYEPGDNFGNTFRVEEGMIKVRYDAYDTFNERFGHLFYEQEYSHYLLRVEYRFVGEQCPGAPG